jgi:hypothetical protein
MRFPTLFGVTANISNTAANYTGIEGSGQAPNASATAFQAPIPVACTIRRFYVRLSEAPGVGKKRVIEIQKNGTPIEGVSITIEGEATTGVWNGEAAIAAGDLVNFKHTPTGEPAVAGRPSGIVEWETEGNVAFTTGSTISNVATGATSFLSFAGATGFANQTVEGTTRIPVPIGFTTTALYVNMSASPGVGKKYELSVRKNSTSDNLAIVIEGSAAFSGNKAGSVAFAAGDTIELKVVPTGTPTARNCRFGIAYEATAKWAGGVIIAAPSNTATNVALLNAITSSWGTGSANTLNIPDEITLSRLFVEHAVAPGVGKSRTDKITGTAISTGIEVKVEGAATSGNDVAHTYTPPAPDLGLRLSSVPTGEPTSDTSVRWGFVSEVLPVGEGGGIVEGKGTFSGSGEDVGETGGTETGTGTLTGSGEDIGEGEGTEVGTGTLEGTGEDIGEGAGTETGTGTLEGEGEVIVEGGGEVAGSGTFTGEGEEEEPFGPPFAPGHIPTRATIHGPQLRVTINAVGARAAVRVEASRCAIAPQKSQASVTRQESRATVTEEKSQATVAAAKTKVTVSP